jgi:hypothetical protein
MVNGSEYLFKINPDNGVEAIKNAKSTLNSVLAVTEWYA